MDRLLRLISSPKLVVRRPLDRFAPALAVERRDRAKMLLREVAALLAENPGRDKRVSHLVEDCVTLLEETLQEEVSAEESKLNSEPA